MKPQGFGGIAIWPMSYGWLCQHLMGTMITRWIGVPAIGRCRPSPMQRCFLGCAEGLRHRALVGYPATSPENSFVYRRTPCNNALGHHSNAIVREVFGNILRIRDILGHSATYEKIEAMLPKLPPYQVGSGPAAGWDQEYPEPSRTIATFHTCIRCIRGGSSPCRTPDMAQAVKPR